MLWNGIIKAEKVFFLRCKIFFTRNISHSVQIIILHTLYPSDVIIPLGPISRFFKLNTSYGIQVMRIDYYGTSMSTQSSDSITLQSSITILFRIQEFDFCWRITLSVMTSFIYVYV